MTESKTINEDADAAEVFVETAERLIAVSNFMRIKGHDHRATMVATMAKDLCKEAGISYFQRGGN